MIAASRFIYASLIAFCCVECVAQKKVTRIEFQSSTRTYREQIIVTPDSVWTMKENFRSDLPPKVMKRTISRHEWNSLVGALGEVDPATLPQMKSPTDKRTYDAASHSRIEIRTADTGSYTHGFDDTAPNEKLKPLLEAILALDQE